MSLDVDSARAKEPLPERSYSDRSGRETIPPTDGRRSNDGDAAAEFLPPEQRRAGRPGRRSMPTRS